MRKFALTTGALAAVMTLGLVACDDEAGTPTPTTDTIEANDTVGAGDSVAESDTLPAADVTPADTTPVDPCVPNPCTNPPANGCTTDATKVISYAATSTCTATGGVASCGAYAPTETACTGGDICSGGACAAPGDPCDYVFNARVSYVTRIALASQSTVNGADGKPEDHCCFDFNDGDPKKGGGTYDDAIDNKLGEILALAANTLGFDLNGMLQEQIDTGSIALLLETAGVEDAVNDTDLTINGFLADDADADLTNNASGTAEFIVKNTSFKAGTKAPLISFAGTKITAGLLSAGPSLFTLSLPILEGTMLDLAISSTRIEGPVTVGPNGQGLAMTAMKLGGVVTLADLYAAINSYVTSSCVVVSDIDALLVSQDANGAWACAKTADVSKTACETDDPAIKVVDYCGLLLTLVKPDVDSSDDGVLDAVSIGIWLDATSATAKPDAACTMQ